MLSRLCFLSICRVTKSCFFYLFIVSRLALHSANKCSLCRGSQECCISALVKVQQMQVLELWCCWAGVEQKKQYQKLLSGVP